MSHYNFYKHLLTCTQEEFDEVYDDILDKAIKYSIISPFELDNIISIGFYDKSIYDRVKEMDEDIVMSDMFSDVKINSASSSSKLKFKRPRSKKKEKSKEKSKEKISNNELDKMTNSLGNLLNDFSDVSKKLKF